MKTQQLFAIFKVGFRLAVIALVILTLGLSGASAAERLYAAGQETKETAEPTLPDHASLKADPTAEEPSEGMAPGSQPWTEQAACLQSPVTLTSGNSDGRSLIDETSCPGDRVLSRRVDSDHTATTSSQVNSHLGKQFTLVGAKPSGTS